jgi:hypothetical protein
MFYPDPISQLRGQISNAVRKWLAAPREAFAGVIANRYAREKKSLYADEPVRLEPWEARFLLSILRRYHYNHDHLEHCLRYYGFDSELELAKLVGFSKGQVLPDDAWARLNWYEYYQGMYARAASKKSSHTTWGDLLGFLDRQIYPPTK